MNASDTPESLLRVPDGKALEFPIDPVCLAIERADAILEMVYAQLDGQTTLPNETLAIAVGAVQGIMSEIGIMVSAHSNDLRKSKQAEGV